jgi:hypothetical protein
MPRIVLACIYLFSHWFAMSYKTAMWPILGFMFMPYTTLAYMGAMLRNHHSLSGFWLFVFVIALLIDLGQLKIFK